MKRFSFAFVFFVVSISGFGAGGHSTGRGRALGRPQGSGKFVEKDAKVYAALVAEQIRASRQLVELEALLKEFRRTNGKAMDAELEKLHAAHKQENAGIPAGVPPFNAGNTVRYKVLGDKVLVALEKAGVTLNRAKMMETDDSVEVPGVYSGRNYLFTVREGRVEISPMAKFDADPTQWETAMNLTVKVGPEEKPQDIAVGVRYDLNEPKVYQQSVHFKNKDIIDSATVESIGGELLPTLYPDKISTDFKKFQFPDPEDRPLE